MKSAAISKAMEVSTVDSPETTPLYNNIGLVIQGPIHSRGRNPLASTLPHEKVIPTDFVDFDASDNVRELISIGQQVFRKSICVTWEGEDTSALQDLVTVGQVDCIPNTTPVLKGRTKLLPVNNKLKQFVSTEHGLKLLNQDPRIEYALKVRTDQMLDLETLARSIISYSQSSVTKDWLLVPTMMPGMNFGLHDFYLGGPIAKFLQVCQLFTARPEHQFANNVHVDFFGRLSSEWLGTTSQPKATHFLLDGNYSAVTSKQKKIAAEMWDKHLATFPRKVWEGLQWRGQQMHRSYYPRNIYSDDSHKTINAQVERLGTEYNSRPNFASKIDNILFVNWWNFLRWRGLKIPRFANDVGVRLRKTFPRNGPCAVESSKALLRLVIPPCVLKLRTKLTKRTKETAETNEWEFDYATTHQRELQALLKDYFEKDEFKFFTSNECPLIIDCGANVGVSVRYWKHLFPKSKIIAFESDPAIFKMLTRNTRDLDGIQLIEGAVWNKNEELRFLQLGGQGGRLEDVTQQGLHIKPTKVKGYRLRDFLSQKIDMLKVDIEGAEIEVFQDCKDLLANAKHIFVEYHSFEDKAQHLGDFIKCIEEAGFRIAVQSSPISKHPFLHTKICNGKDLYLHIFATRVQ